MKITIIAFGSRGDVQPAIAMGVGLQKAGHQVKLAGAIRTAVTDHQMQDKAAELGRKIQAENGVETAVHLFEHYIQ